MRHGIRTTPSSRDRRRDSRGSRPVRHAPRTAHLVASSHIGTIGCQGEELRVDERIQYRLARGPIHATEARYLVTGEIHAWHFEIFSANALAYCDTCGHDAASLAKWYPVTSPPPSAS